MIDNMSRTDEMQQITIEQAKIALSVTQDKWEETGSWLLHNDENSDDHRIMEKSIRNVVALLWIRLVAIGIKSNPVSLHDYCSFPLHHSKQHHHQQSQNASNSRGFADNTFTANNNTSQSYDCFRKQPVDLSTTTICQKILQLPKEQPRNPQDVDDSERLDDNNDNINKKSNDNTKTASANDFKTNNVIHQSSPPVASHDSQSVGPLHKQHSTKSQQLGQFQVPIWWHDQNSNATKESETSSIVQPWEAYVQLRLFVQRILKNHHLNLLPFHNYTHATAVVLRCNKLLDAMLCKLDNDNYHQTNATTESVASFHCSDKDVLSINQQSFDSHHMLRAEGPKGNLINSSICGMGPRFGMSGYEYDDDFAFDGRQIPPTFGIRTDPLLQFALLFAGLVHDVAHQGVTNRQLCIEQHPLATLYNDQSVQEKNSLKIAFDELLKPNYDGLRILMFGCNPTESTTSSTHHNPNYRRFRQTVINAVMSTDIARPEQTVVTKSKWKEAFYAYNIKLMAAAQIEFECNQSRHSASNHEEGHPLSGQTEHDFVAGTAARRGSLLSVISNPGMKLSKYAYASDDYSFPVSGTSNDNLHQLRPGPIVRRRGSNVSNITEMSEDFRYYPKLLHLPRRGSACSGRQQCGNNAINRFRSKSMSGALQTVPSQRTLPSSDIDFDCDFHDEPFDSKCEQQPIGMSLSSTIQHSHRIVLDRRGSHLSTLSDPFEAKGRRLSLTNKVQQNGRRYSNGSVAYHPCRNRRGSNESYTNHGYQVHYDVEDYSYNGSDIGNDSEIGSNKNPKASCSRRMSNGSVDSYCASEWGGDSVGRRNMNHPVINEESEGIIQHGRYPHPEYEHNTHQRNIRQVNRRSSIDVSSNGETFQSDYANSIEVNKKRLEEDFTGGERSNRVYKETKQIFIATDDGDPIDISRYVWSEDNDESMSLTPPSSVEDEFGGYAAEYAAKFKNMALVQETHVSILHNKTESQAEPHPPSQNLQDQVTTVGEYCGRVIVATTITDIPINRRGSVSAGYVSTWNHDCIEVSSSELHELNVSGRTATGFFQVPSKALRLNRRASTGNVPMKSFPTTLGPLPENVAGIGGRRKRHRRSSMGTINSNDGISSTVANGSQPGFSTPSEASKLRKRLGICRSMDLSGHSIDVYGRHDDNDAMSAVSNDELMLQYMDTDEPDELRAAVVIETFLRVADVGHSLQNWESMVAWSSRLFHELCNANESDRGHNPRDTWYSNQICIMDSYLKPLAQQMDEMGVFGEFNGVLWLQCVDTIRRRWITEGEKLTEKLCKEADQRRANCEMDMMRFM